MNIIRRIVELFTPLAGGSLIGKMTAKEAPKDFKKFKKPPFSPPKKAFPIVWPILYLMMGVVRGGSRRQRQMCIRDRLLIMCN